MGHILRVFLIYALGVNFCLIGIDSFADEKSTTPEIEKQILEIQNRYGFAVIEPRCVGDKEDPFEMGAVMPGGFFKGQCIDAENNRPPFVLSSVAALNSELDAQPIEVANIRHANQWWIGRIEPDSIDRVYYEIVEYRSSYPGIRNDHVEIRFVFKKNSPIQLRSQVVTQNKREELDDLVVSHNAYGVHGLGFNPFLGVQNRFAILGRMVSTYDRANDEIVNENGRVYQIELNLSDRQKYDLLLKAVQRDSQMIGYKWLYHTLFMNCAVSLFDLLDATIQRPDGVPSYVQAYSQWLGSWQWLYGSNWLAILPFIRDLIFQPSIDALHARHLVNRWVPTLNEEFNNGEVSLGKTQKHQDTVRHPDHPRLW
jgi:hypothetical protein